MDESIAMRLEELSPAQLQWGLFGIVAIGLLYCFVGYRLFWLILGLTGFLIAGAVAAAIAGWLSQGNLVAMAVGMLIGGVCGAMALMFLYKAGVFLLGFAVALIIAYHVLHARPESWAPPLSVVAGLAGGVIALFIERPVMTLATAVLGAWLAVAAGALWWYEIDVPTDEPATVIQELEPRLALGLLGAWVVLAIIGMMMQFRLGVKKAKPAT